MKKNLLPLNLIGNQIERSITNGGILSAKKEILASGLEIITLVKIPHLPKKASYVNIISDLRNRGWTQQAISFVTDISQPYISKLLK